MATSVGVEVLDGGGLPALSRGGHQEHDHDHRVCVMELTAFLAGEPHGDRPAGTHPVLAAVARVVNDAVRADALPQLAALSPRLVGTADRSAHRTADLMLELCSRTLFAAPPVWRPRLLRAQREARRDLRQPDRVLTSRALVRAERCATCAAATVALTGASDSETIGVLRRLLDVCEQAGAGPPVFGAGRRSLA